jgi:hypothetical protein
VIAITAARHDGIRIGCARKSFTVPLTLSDNVRPKFLS